jgi:predicted DNA-binding protein YlxM (UPF0122 family)
VKDFDVVQNFYTVQEVANEIGVTRQRVYQMIHEGSVTATVAVVEKPRLVITAKELEKLKRERLGAIDKPR